MLTLCVHSKCEWKKSAEICVNYVRTSRFSPVIEEGFLFWHFLQNSFHFILPKNLELSNESINQWKVLINRHSARGRMDLEAKMMKVIRKPIRTDFAGTSKKVTEISNWNDYLLEWKQCIDRWCASTSCQCSHRPEAHKTFYVIFGSEKCSAMTSIADEIVWPWNRVVRIGVDWNELLRHETSRS